MQQCDRYGSIYNANSAIKKLDSDVLKMQAEPKGHLIFFNKMVIKI